MDAHPIRHRRPAPTGPARDLRARRRSFAPLRTAAVALAAALVRGFGGAARLDVPMAGRTPGGGNSGEPDTFVFAKDVEPKLVDLRFAGGGSGGLSIRLGR